MIAATLCVRDDAPIVGCTMQHMLNEEVDRIYVSVGVPSFEAKDDTMDIVVALANAVPDRVRFYIDTEDVFRQHEMANYLAHKAGNDGAEWIVPFDADEYVYSTTGTVAHTLRHLGKSVGVVKMLPYLHRDWEHRYVGGECRWPKLAYRYTPEADLAVGAHGVSGVPGDQQMGPLALREVQFTSYEEFVAKRDKHLRYNAPALPPTGAAQYRRLEGLGEAELLAEWLDYRGRPVVHDPIPSSFRPPHL